MTVLVIVSICAPTILQTCFRNGKNFPTLPGGSTTLKTLVDSSTSEMKKVIGEQKISSSLAQLQKLDLPRERRRGINRKFVNCLAAGNAKAFGRLKKIATSETAEQIIADFTHSPSCRSKLRDTIEDLKHSMKKKYQAMCCQPGPQPTTDGLGSLICRLLRTTVSYVDIRVFQYAQKSKDLRGWLAKYVVIHN